MDERAKTYIEKYFSTLNPEVKGNKPTWDSYSFCSNQEDADHCAQLVLKGDKRATAGLLWSYEAENEPLPEVGNLSVITNWDGEPQCIIEVTDVQIKPYNEVTSEFAFIEGEGDKSLEYWRRVHWEFFTMECEEIGKQPTEDMKVVLEKFKVIWKE